MFLILCRCELLAHCPIEGLRGLPSACRWLMRMRNVKIQFINGVPHQLILVSASYVYDLYSFCTQSRGIHEEVWDSLGRIFLPKMYVFRVLPTLVLLHQGIGVGLTRPFFRPQFGEKHSSPTICCFRD